MKKEMKRNRLCPQKQTGAHHNRLLTTQNKLRVAGGEVGEGGARWVTGTEEGAGWDERRVWPLSDASPESTPETDTTVCVNQPELQ